MSQLICDGKENQMIALLADAKLEALAQELATIRPCPMAGRITADQVKLALAGHGILPTSVAGLEAD